MQDREIMWVGFEEGKSAYQLSRELKMDLKIVQEQQERFELQNKVFEPFMSQKQEDLHQYAIIINITEVQVKKRLLADVHPGSRMFMRVGLTTGGTVKNTGYKPVVADMNFQWNSFLPRVQDLTSFIKVGFSTLYFCRTDSTFSKVFAAGFAAF